MICPDRGAIQPCTVDAGHGQVEVSLADWSDGSDPTLLLGDMVIRYGLDDSTEVQLGISPWVHKTWGIGHSDLKLTLRHRILSGPISLAIQPMITLPVGSKKLTQDQVGAGLALGATWDLNQQTQLYVSPYSIITPNPLEGVFIGVNQTIKGPLGASAELMVQHQHQTQSSLDFGLTYTARKDLEFDLSTNLGMTSATPALEIMVGVSRRF